MTCYSRYSPTTSVSSRFVRSEKQKYTPNAGWNFISPTASSRGKDNANTDFLSQLPFPPTAEDIQALPHLRLIPRFCSIPEIGSGGLISRPDLDTLLKYSHRRWEQLPRDGPLCQAASRYLQLGYSKPIALSLCDDLPSHKRPDHADILALASKGRLIDGDEDTLLLAHNPTVVSPSGWSPFDDPVHIYVPLLARSQIMHVCHADASCYEGATRTLIMLQRLYWWIRMEACTKRSVRRCLKFQERKTSR